MKTVSFIGVGRLGGALAIALSRAGFRVDQLIYRNSPPLIAITDAILGRPTLVSLDQLRSIGSDVLFITTGDEQIETVCTSVAPLIDGDTVVFHSSGALSSAVLSAAAEKGIATGSVHPLISISDAVRGAELLAKAFFCVEGKDEAVDEAELIVKALGGTSFTIDTEFKPLYHAAAVLSSGHMIALFETAVETLTKCGLDRDSARRVLYPLVSSSIGNLSDQETAAALTGPFSRVDGSAIIRHLESFDRAELTDARRTYIDLGLKALELAERNGAAASELDHIRETLKLALTQGRC